MAIMGLMLCGCSKQEEEPGLTSRLRAEITEIMPKKESPTYTEAPRMVDAPSPVIQYLTQPLGELKPGEEIPVGMRVLEKRFDPNNINITVLLRNGSDNGVRIRLYHFGYDKNNRLIDSGDRALYFQPREQMIQNYTFKRLTGITRWVLAVR